MYLFRRIHRPLLFVCLCVSLLFFLALYLCALLGSLRSSTMGMGNNIKTTTPLSPSYTCVSCEEYRSCLVRRLEEQKANLWQYLSVRVLDKCLSQDSAKDLKHFLKRKVKKIDNQTDRKFVILPEIPDNASCTLVTIGIGYDIKAEQRVKLLQPNCEFFGAEPVGGLGEIYHKIGSYFKTAIGTKTGVLEVSVMRGWIFSRERMEGVGLADFLTNYVRREVVDHLWIDIEGGEYPLLPLFSSNALPTICQMSFEFHGPPEKHNLTALKYYDLLHGMVRDSPFLPLVSTAAMETYRAYWVNVRSPLCTHKYLHALLRPHTALPRQPNG